MNKGNLRIVGLIGIVILLSVATSVMTVFAFGGFRSYAMPHSFATGTTISADEMNANFSYIENALNDFAGIGNYLTAVEEEDVNGGFTGTVTSAACDAGDLIMGCDCTSNTLKYMSFSGVRYSTDDQTCTCEYYNTASSNILTIYAKALCMDRP